MLSRGAWPLLFACVIIVLILILPSYGGRHVTDHSATASHSSSASPAATRQRQRQLYGRAERHYIKGELYASASSCNHNETFSICLVAHDQGLTLAFEAVIGLEALIGIDAESGALRVILCEKSPEMHAW